MMIAEKTLCIALCGVGAFALGNLCGRYYLALVRGLVARRLRLERKARKRLDVTRIMGVK